MAFRDGRRLITSLLIKPYSFLPLYLHNTVIHVTLPSRMISLLLVLKLCCKSLFKTTAGESEVVRAVVDTVLVHALSPIHLQTIE